MNNMNNGSNLLKDIKMKAATTVSDLLTDSGEKGAKEFCVLIYLSEPNYPIELLKDE